MAQTLSKADLTRLETAARRGDLSACYTLGMTAASPQVAAEWFRFGAERASHECALLLAVAYARGEGVVRDLPRAVALFNLAGALGSKEGARVRDALLPYLSPQERERSTEWASRWHDSLVANLAKKKPGAAKK